MGERQLIPYTYTNYYDGELEYHPPSPPTFGSVAEEAVILAGRGIHDVLLERGHGAQAKSSHCEHETNYEYVTEMGRIKAFKYAAGTRVGDASASASRTAVGAKAAANAKLAEAKASAEIFEGIMEAKAKAVYGEADAHAGIGIEQLGAHAGAAATTVKVEAGISNTPLQAYAQGPGADAEAGVSWKLVGASAGIYAGEVKAGPFAARAGVKFGGGIRYGIPEIDAGPVTVPCSIQ